MADDSDVQTVGQQLRTIRRRRRLTQKVVAELAGISASYLSMIENGERPVEKRSTLEGLARALRVSPHDLGALPVGGASSDPEMSEALAGLPDLEDVLTSLPPLEASVTPRPWPAVAADVERLGVLRPSADLVAQIRLIPPLLAELNSLAAATGDPRIVAATAYTYYTASSLARDLGARTLPSIAALHVRVLAQHLDQPRFLGLARWCRFRNNSAFGRARSRTEAIETAAMLEPFIGSDVDSRQVYGMCHLSAGLNSAAVGDVEAAFDHLREARGVAPDPAVTSPGFAQMAFSRINVDFWEVAITLEVGEPDRVIRELHPRIVPERMESRYRQGAYWVDIGRALARDRRTRPQAVEALMRAEELAPVGTRANVWVRETVADLVYKTRRDAVGADLRGLAYRMQVA